MSGFTLLGFTILKSQAEKEIQKLFEHYERTLSDQKQKMCDDITEWGDALVRNIYKHVNQQKYHLEQEHANQMRNLNKTYDQFIDELRVHEQSNNTEQITQLLDQCKALKFELATLKYNKQTILFVEVPSKQPLVMNRDGSDVIETEYDQSNNSSTVKYDNETEENNMNTHSTLYRNMAFTNTKQTDTQSSWTNSDSVYDRSTNSNNDHKSYDVKDDNLIEKCPICFMIFPSTMTASNRSQHIQEHCTDD